MKFILPYFEYFRGNAESLLLSFRVRTKEVLLPGKGGGGYCHIWAIFGMCRCEGYGFQAVYSGIG